MNMQLQTESKAEVTFAPVHSGILQRKCEDCRKKRLQRSALDSAEKGIVPPIVQEVLNSPGQPLDTGTRAFMEPRFGHDFSQVRVHADLKEPAPTEPEKSKKESGTGAHPYTASASIASSSSEGCRVPSGNYGSAKIIKFRIIDFNGKPVNENLTVGEKFTSIEDNYRLFSRLIPNSYDCRKGFFDDCYRLYRPEPLPDDFRLVVEQNHLLGSEVISKNHITYTPDSILARIFPRLPGKHDFESRSKMY